VSVALDLIGIIQATVRDELRGYRTAELGVVTDIHPHASAGDRNNDECDLRLRDSGLELKRVPVATQRIGAVAMPNVGDLVLVQFLAGDVHSAIVTGRLYNDEDRPPEADAHEAVYVSPDPAASGVRRFHGEFPKDNVVHLDDDELRIEMAGTTLQVKHDGDIVGTSSTKLVLTDGSSNSVTVDVAPGQVTVKGAVKVVVEAPMIELVDGATHPVPFGDLLLQYLNQVAAMYQSHVHPGEMALGVFPVTPAPPVPPFPPATPSLISMRVKTG
jgi:phage baseplate assembly protein gpV